MNESGKCGVDKSCRVRTHEKNSGDAVRRLGKIIQSIFCAQSGASIRLTVWKWSGESRYPGAFPSAPGIRECNQGNKKLLCSLCNFCARTMHSAPWPSRPHIMHIGWQNKDIPRMWTDFAKTSLYSIQSGADHTHQKYDCKFAFCLSAIAFVFFFYLF